VTMPSIVIHTLAASRRFIVLPEDHLFMLTFNSHCTGRCGHTREAEGLTFTVVFASDSHRDRE